MSRNSPLSSPPSLICCDDDRQAFFAATWRSNSRARSGGGVHYPRTALPSQARSGGTRCTCMRYVVSSTCSWTLCVSVYFSKAAVSGRVCCLLCRLGLVKCLPGHVVHALLVQVDLLNRALIMFTERIPLQ